MVDYPDGVQVVQVAVTVEGLPVIPQPATEVPAGDVGRYSGTSTSYQSVASWTVATDKQGKLKEVALRSSNYAKTLWKLVIGATTFMTDVTVGGALTLPFSDLSLAAGDTVTLSAKSSDGTTITADGAIAGEELG